MKPLSRRLSVAPMMDWSDRHCRFFHRLITRETLLYTEMVTTGALIHGDIPRHLAYHDEEHPVALQLGGSEPVDLAHCAKLGEQWGYDEINLNCGCPSERVQRGAFGACLMREPQTVADCVKAMKDAVGIPVTVKHRIGVDDLESYDFVRDFVGQVSLAGCEVFIVHARSAWLQGLSPKENREIPPLRYDVVSQLKADFPHLQFILNGGLSDNAAIQEILGSKPSTSSAIDGVMVGRAAYHTPYMMREWDRLIRFHDEAHEGVHANPRSSAHAPTHSNIDANIDAVSEDLACPEPPSREALELAYVHYMQRLIELPSSDPVLGAQTLGPYTHMSRHMLGLWHGQAGARRWRHVWSDPSLKHLSVMARWKLATQARLQATEQALSEPERPALGG